MPACRVLVCINASGCMLMMAVVWEKTELKSVKNSANASQHATKNAAARPDSRLSATPAKKCEILMQKCEIVLNAIFSTNRPANTSFHACGMQDPTRTRPSRLSFMEKKTHKVPWDLQSVSLYSCVQTNRNHSHTSSMTDHRGPPLLLTLLAALSTRSSCALLPNRVVKPHTQNVALIGIPDDRNSSFVQGPAAAPPLIRAAIASDSANAYCESTQIA